MGDISEIISILKKFGNEILQNESTRIEGQFTKDKKANQFILRNSNAFFLGVVFDQGIPAEWAWSAPYFLFKRLGHLDIHKISDMKIEDLQKAISKKPALHRYIINMPKFIQDSCKLLVTKYSCRAENIWNDNPTAKELEKRFREFKGIGQKKASMALSILARTFRIPMRNLEGMDVAYDVHVKRVFMRTGLAQKGDMKSILNAARKLNPKFPGELDLPAWYIGKYYCHARKPECERCVLNKICPKKGLEAK